MLTSIVIENIGGRFGNLQQVVISDNCFGFVVHEFKRNQPNRYGYVFFYLFKIYRARGLNPTPNMVKALSILYKDGCDCYAVVRNAATFYKDLMPNTNSFEKYKLLMERYYIPYSIGQKNF